MTIHLTDAAIARIEKYIKGQNQAIVRISVKQSGCSGFSYHIDWDQQIEAEDHCFPYEHFQIVIAEKDKDKLDGITVDVKKQGLNEQFVFINPNARHTCGCGSSFAV